jgi:hypothetical protein
MTDDFKTKLDTFFQGLTNKINDNTVQQTIQNEYNSLIDICILNINYIFR